MRAEIVCIGTELLVGSIINTNASHLSRRLADLGVDVYRHTTVGDNVDRIVMALEEASLRSQLVITTGGLGPTADDVTSEAVGRFLREPLVLHRPTEKHILERLRFRKMKMTPLIRRQCFIPRGVTVLRNKRGTAAGYLAETPNGSWVLVFPGPPREMEPMLEEALPELRRRGLLKPSVLLRRSVRVSGLIEAQVAEKTTDLLNLKPPVTVGIYAKPGDVELKIMAKAATPREAARRADAVEKTIRRRLGDAVYGVDGETVASAAIGRLRKAKKTVSTAESCTGGLAAGRLTDTPGSSEAFKGGIVAYKKSAKALLGVEAAGDPVSAEVSEGLARGAQKLFGADYGIGITGNAGPGVDKNSKEPEGTVFISLAGPSGVKTKKHRFLGTRAEVRSRAALEAVDFLRRSLKP